MAQNSVKRIVVAVNPTNRAPRRRAKPSPHDDEKDVESDPAESEPQHQNPQAKRTAVETAFATQKHRSRKSAHKADD